MAHELDTFADGRARMVYAEGYDPWHGLGQRISNPYDIPGTCKEAGLVFRYVVVRDKVMIQDADGIEYPTWADYNRTVVKREPGVGDVQLTGVGSHWQVKGHQPQDLVAFFQEVSHRVEGTARITTAGSLRRGGCVFGAAKFDRQVRVFGQDPTDFYLVYLMSVYKAADKIMLTGVNVVCNNTFEAAFNRDRAGAISLPHYGTLDDDAVDSLVDRIGLVDLSVIEDDLTKLVLVDLNRRDREDYFTKVLLGEASVMSLTDKRTEKLERELGELEWCYTDSPGQDLAVRQGTVYGAWNAVTNWVDKPDPRQAVGRRSTAEGKWSSILYGSSFDSGRQIKRRAWDNALALAA